MDAETGGCKSSQCTPKSSSEYELLGTPYCILKSTYTSDPCPSGYRAITAQEICALLHQGNITSYTTYARNENGSVVPITQRDSSGWKQRDINGNVTNMGTLLLSSNYTPCSWVKLCNPTLNNNLCQIKSGLYISYTQTVSGYNDCFVSTSAFRCSGTLSRPDCIRTGN